MHFWKFWNWTRAISKSSKITRVINLKNCPSRTCDYWFWLITPNQQTLCTETKIFQQRSITNQRADNYKIFVAKYLTEFTGKHLYPSSFFNKVASFRSTNLLKRDTGASEFWSILRCTFLINHLGNAAFICSIQDLSISFPQTHKRHVNTKEIYATFKGMAS